MKSDIFIGMRYDKKICVRVDKTLLVELSSNSNCNQRSLSEHIRDALALYIQVICRNNSDVERRVETRESPVVQSKTIKI